MDESFAYFLKQMGPPLQRRAVDPARLTRYRGRLPDRLLDYWRDHGDAGYAEGRFWTVDPGDYAEVLARWLAATPYAGRDDYAVIARSAFGDLHVWGTRSGHSLHLVPALGLLFPNPAAARLVHQGRADLALEAFFVARTPAASDLSDEAGRPLFARALQRLGPLDADSVYAFEPALALGGTASLDALRKVGLIGHLDFLAGLAPLRILENPLLRAQG